MTGLTGFIEQWTGLTAVLQRQILISILIVLLGGFFGFSIGVVAALIRNQRAARDS